jgi:hypothetical protein
MASFVAFSKLGRDARGMLGGGGYSSFAPTTAATAATTTRSALTAKSRASLKSVRAEVESELTRQFSHPEFAELEKFVEKRRKGVITSAPVLGEDGQESSQMSFLLQTMRMKKDPNAAFRKLNEVGDTWSVPVNEAIGVGEPHRFSQNRQDLLRWGTSQTGEGRAAYLRTAYASLPQERYFTPKTSAQEIGFYTSTQHEFDSEKQVHVTKPMSVSEPPPKPMLPAPPRVAKIFNKRTPLEGGAGFAALHGAFKQGGAKHDFA